MNTDGTAGNEFREWLMIKAAGVVNGTCSVETDPGLKPIFDYLCGKPMAMRMAGFDCSPCDCAYANLFVDLLFDQPRRPAKAVVKDIMVGFFTRVAATTSPENLPTSKQALLDYLTVLLVYPNNPRCRRVWRSEETYLLENAIKSLGKPHRLTVLRLITPTDTDTKAEVEQAIYDAFAALKGTSFVRAIRRNLGIDSM